MNELRQQDGSQGGPMAAEKNAALRLEHVSRSFSQGAARLDVIKNASLTLPRGEMVALVGPSGSGKSTLLHIAGLLERPDSGEIWILDNPRGKLSDARRPELRPTAIGFASQYHHLLPKFSPLEKARK